MSRLALLPLLLFAAAPAAAAEVTDYAVRLALDASGGGRAAVHVRLASAAPGVVDLPLGFAGVGDLRLTAGPVGTKLEALPHNDQTILRVGLPADAPAEVDLGLDFAVADQLRRPTARTGDAKTSASRGRRVFRNALLNSQAASIRHYRFEVIFPDGMRAHAIRHSTPPLRAGEVGPRAQLDAIAGRYGASLGVDALLQGETATLQLELVRRGRSPIWLLAGVTLSLLYLVGFRDLVARPR